MFNKTYAQAKELYKDLITEVWEESFTIIMTDTDSTIGLASCSDIILVFAPTGELVLMTERIYNKKYNFVQWLKLRRTIKKERSKYIGSATVFTSINRGTNFMDWTLYKKWWHEWARELV